MIIPHHDKELELMLKSKKQLAMFFDILPKNISIAEEIIPETAFAPYVSKGFFCRHQRDIVSKKSGETVRIVCFTTPKDNWRAEFIFWVKERLYNGDIYFCEAYDAVIGSLLGYKNLDIADFLQHQSKRFIAA